MLHLGRYFRYLLAAIGLIVALYCGLAVAGSVIPRNANWREPQQGITVYVVTNGYHSGLIVPAVVGDHDWRQVIRPGDLADPNDAGNWLLFGWGDRDFYLNTPRLSDMTPGSALAALGGSGRTLVHVDHLDRPGDVADPRPLRLTARQYRQLARFITTTLARADGRALPIKGYGDRDVFYEARGRYNLITTCNVWTGNALAAAGVRVGLWTPFSGGLMWWF